MNKDNLFSLSSVRISQLAALQGPDVSQNALSPVRRIKFVEQKTPDLKRVGQLFEECAAVNQWANFGPLYDRLSHEYIEHMGLAPELTLSPCANGGIGLEILARTLAADAGQDKLRWVGSAFSFKNLGRGYFADMHFVDCDAQGLLNLVKLQSLAEDSFDGIIVTNPFGMCTDFTPYIRFAETTGKRLIIDNAAGLSRDVPPWPWQSFSLHHTKPYGIGEGGLVLSPTPAADFLRLLINYDQVPLKPAYWLNNGKISDIACAFHLARLQQIADWEPGYKEERARIAGIFAKFGLKPLLPLDGAPLTNSLPVLLPAALDDTKLNAPRRIDIARQYPPLAPLPRAQDIHQRIINFPTHPDLRLASDLEITEEIDSLLACCV